MPLLSHFKDIADRTAAAAPGGGLKLDIVLVSGATCSGELVSIFNDGFSIMDGSRIAFVPMTGLALVSFDEPVFAPPPKPDDKKGDDKGDK